MTKRIRQPLADQRKHRGIDTESDAVAQPDDAGNTRRRWRLASRLGGKPSRKLPRDRRRQMMEKGEVGRHAIAIGGKMRAPQTVHPCEITLA